MNGINNDDSLPSQEPSRISLLNEMSSSGDQSEWNKRKNPDYAWGDKDVRINSVKKKGINADFMEINP
jgi:hypothetical protein